VTLSTSDNEQGGSFLGGAALSEEQVAAVAASFEALADPTRVRIVSVLRQGKRCVGELASILGMSDSAISHQLRLLRNLRAVTSRREGRHIYYALADEHIEWMYDYAVQHALER